jgi:hypothetical protein
MIKLMSISKEITLEKGFVGSLRMPTPSATKELFPIIAYLAIDRNAAEQNSF